MTPRPLPSPLDLGPFRVGEARPLGVTEKRLRASDLAAPFHGVRQDGAKGSGLWSRCEAYLVLLRPGQAFSHVTAAALWGLPLPRSAVDGDLHVTGPVEIRPRRVGVVAHAQSGAVGGTFVDILPVVDPVTAWLQCASLLPLDEVIAMGDALAGTWSSLEGAHGHGLDELAAAVGRWGRRRGAAILRSALIEMRAGVGSPKETEVRLLLVRAGVREPACNGRVVTTPDGVDLHGDLVWRLEKVVLEYEGDGHRVRRRQWMHDLERYELFQDDGWRVVRVTDRTLEHGAELVARVSRLLAERAVR